MHEKECGASRLSLHSVDFMLVLLSELLPSLSFEPRRKELRMKNLSNNLEALYNSGSRTIEVLVAIGKIDLAAFDSAK